MLGRLKGLGKLGTLGGWGDCSLFSHGDSERIRYENEASGGAHRIDDWGQIARTVAVFARDSGILCHLNQLIITAQLNDTVESGLVALRGDSAFLNIEAV